MNIVNTTVRSILTDMIQVGIAIGAGEELDKDKEWHLERATQSILEQLKALLPEKKNDNYVTGKVSLDTTKGFNQAIDIIEKAIKEWAK